MVAGKNILYEYLVIKMVGIMELRSFLAGILFLYGIGEILPALGIKVAVTMPAPWMSLVAGVIALVLAYYLFRN